MPGGYAVCRRYVVDDQVVRTDYGDTKDRALALEQFISEIDVFWFDDQIEDV